MAAKSLPPAVQLTLHEVACETRLDLTISLHIQKVSHHHGRPTEIHLQ
jgi:hypothetical protein